MKNPDVIIFTGSEANVLLLKACLEEIGILSMIRDDFKSGIMAGFGGGVVSSVDLYIKMSDLEKAQPLVAEFNKIIK